MSSSSEEEDRKLPAKKLGNENEQVEFKKKDRLFNQDKKRSQKKKKKPSIMRIRGRSIVSL